MGEYRIKISELLETTISVETDSSDEAMDKVKSMYRNSEIILTADDHTVTEFTAVDEEPSDEKGVALFKKCTCGNKSFAAQQISFHHVVITGSKVFDAGVHASRQPYGPFICTKCEKRYNYMSPKIESAIREYEGDHE